MAKMETTKFYTALDLNEKALVAANLWLEDHERDCMARKVEWTLEVKRGSIHLAIWFRDTQGFENRTKIALS